jgi:hypothetical protein
MLGGEPVKPTVNALDVPPEGPETDATLGQLRDLAGLRIPKAPLVEYRHGNVRPAVAIVVAEIADVVVRRDDEIQLTATFGQTDSA